MKVLDQGAEFYSRGTQNSLEYEFSQNQSAKLMDMISNSLYSNKVKAPVRELSTNAWDAHVLAGTTNKVPTLHLPNAKDPEFRLRDYGTGLSPEQMDTVYRKYGESDKINSNEFNGCMGIGSKSPFAYTRSFATTSYYNGMKYVYVNAKNRDNKPVLDLIHSEETYEPNGVEVSFAVEAKDFNAFENSAKEVLRWFPTPFKVTGGSRYDNFDYKIPDRQYSMEGDGWKIRSDTNESCAIMGYVEYPIEAKHFTSDTSRQNDWYRYYDKTPHVQLLNLGLELHFEIGEVEMDISRERLQYSPNTIDRIKERLDRALEEIKTKINERFKDAKTLWDARLLYHDLYNGDLRNVRDLINITGTEWNGHKLEDLINYKDFPAGVNIIKFGDSYGRSIKRTDNVYGIEATNKVAFYENDLKRGSYVACQRQLTDSKDISIIYLLKFDNKKAKKDFCDLLGIDPSLIKKTSDVPKPVPEKRKPNPKLYVFKEDARKYNSHRQYHQHSYWEKDEVDFKKGGLYVELNNWKVLTETKKNQQFSGADLQNIFDAFTTLGIRKPRIIAVKTAIVEKYQKSKKWTDFFTWAEKKIEDRIKLQKLENVFGDIQKINEYERNGYKFQISPLSILENSKVEITNKDCSLQKLADRLVKLASVRDTWQSKISVVENVYRKVCKTNNAFLTNNNSMAELKDLYDQMLVDYPFIKLLDRWDTQNSEKCTIICDTINLVNSFKGESVDE